jgi:hypothetical protein
LKFNLKTVLGVAVVAVVAQAAVAHLAAARSK